MAIHTRLRKIGPTALLVAVAVTTLAFVSGCGAYMEGPPNPEISSVAQEYPELYDYGNWIDISPWGPVWEPNVGPDWSPFEYGNWLDTDDGWMWSSYEPWGNIVYHYGQWDNDPVYGWYWIPGNTWSPARVRWAVYGDYIGWRPLGPNADHDRGPWADHDHDHHGWTVVPARDFDHDNVGQYRVEHPPKMRDRERRVQVFHEPTTPTIMRQTGHRPKTVTVTKEHRMVHNRPVTIVRLPERERQRVERHREQVREKVLRHPESHAASHAHEEHHEEKGHAKGHGKH